MATVYRSGQSNIFGADGAFMYLGGCEQTVRVSASVKHRGVSADFAGDMDADISMTGEIIFVSFRLVRPNAPVLALCKTRLESSLSPGPGRGSPGALGALLGVEGNTFGLVVQSQFASKAPFANAGMVPAIHLPNAYIAQSTELGTGVKVEQVMFRALASFGLDGSYTARSRRSGRSPRTGSCRRSGRPSAWPPSTRRPAGGWGPRRSSGSGRTNGPGRCGSGGTTGGWPTPSRSSAAIRRSPWPTSRSSASGSTSSGSRRRRRWRGGSPRSPTTS